MKYTLHTLLAICLILIGSVLFSQKTEVAQGFANLTTYTQTPVATSTPAFLQWGIASSTLTVPTNGLDTLEVSTLFTASTSLTNYDVKFYTSSDAKDFYLLSAFSTTTIPESTNATFRAFSITPTGAYTRIDVTVGTSSSLSSRGSLYLKAGAR